MLRENDSRSGRPRTGRRRGRKAVAGVCSCLRDVARDYAPVVFANSLGAEDMVLTDMIWGESAEIGIFSLDTGRLPAETYELMARAERHYGRRLEVFAPRHDTVQDFVTNFGINGFYDSVEARKACCHARKIEPLQRALAGKQAWITGLRAAQSPTRDKLKTVAFDQRQQPGQDQPAGGLERARSLGLSARQPGALQRAARSRLSEHRLRPLHPRRAARRGCPRGTLVVGKRGHQRVRPASGGWQAGTHRARRCKKSALATRRWRHERARLRCR
jgi:hypothetical protein